MALRLAVVVTHPIQHFAPWHREVARLDEIGLRVFFSSDLGVTEFQDEGFGRSFKWDVPLTEGYSHEFPPSSRRSRRLGFFAMDNPGISAGLDRFDPHVVQVFGHAYRTFWRVVAWARRRNRPVMLYSDAHLSEYEYLSRFKVRVKETVIPFIYRRVDGAMYVGDNNRDLHRHFGMPAERLFAGCLPIDRARLLGSVIDRGAARREVRARHGVPDEAFVALFCGKFLPRKRAIDLLEACASRASGPRPCWALLVGDGLERPRLEAWIREHGASNVVLTGFVNQASIPEYYAAADLMAVPSDVDPHPLVVTEAAAFGLPVVASDALGCVGPHDTARPEENAIVYPAGDAAGLRAALQRLRDDDALRARMSAASARIAEGQDLGTAARQLAEATRALHDLGRR